MLSLFVSLYLVVFHTYDFCLAYERCACVVLLKYSGMYVYNVYHVVWSLETS
jgi:hypothetical protein